jgi:protein-S-isoprenylcysteine O-methyltransferase Ste14
VRSQSRFIAKWRISADFRSRTQKTTNDGESGSARLFLRQPCIGPKIAPKEAPMRTRQAIAGSALFFIAAPGVVAGLLPWLLTDRYRMPWSTLPGLVPVGWVLIVVATALLLHAFARFALEGLGTPAPVAPTERLVVGGIYRHVRNPMYVAVLAIILGQALLFSSAALVAYAAIAAIAMVSFVKFHEEPTLARRYGAEYEAYRHAVPGWLPRLTPWRGQ